MLAQWSILKNALKWDVEQVSKKTLRVKDADEGFPVSGHMGEWLGCLGGTLRSYCVASVLIIRLHSRALTHRPYYGVNQSKIALSCYKKTMRRACPKLSETVKRDFVHS